MAGIHDPLKVNLGVADYLRNAYQLGTQREQREKPPDERINDDRVELTTARGTKAGFQTGIVQHKAKASASDKKRSGPTPGSPADGPSGMLPPSLPGKPAREGLPAPVAPSGGQGADTLAQRLTMAQIAQSEALKVNEAYWQMAAERQKHSWKIIELLQDLQNEIMKTITDIATKRDKVLTEIATQWAAVLGGYELK